MSNTGMASFSWSGWLLLGILIAMTGVSCTKVPRDISLIPPAQEKVEPPPRPELTKMELWRQLVVENHRSPVDKKLTSVNRFFNQFDFIEDKYLWGPEDYWATLFETLIMSAGDCEDITIAKYFTLKDLNIHGGNMRLTYVFSVKTKKPHIVLTFQPDSRKEPLVLDTATDHLFPVSKRPDLVPVYSFNEYGYWIARKTDGWKGERLGSPAGIPAWWKLLQRMKMNRFGYSDG